MRWWRVGMGVCAAALWVACGAEITVVEDEDDDGSGTGTGAPPGAPTGSPAGTKTGVGSSGWDPGAGGVPAPAAPPCYQEEAALHAPGDVTLVGLDACTPAQVDAFMEACLPSDTQPSCEAYRTANPTCFGCLVAVDENGNAASSTPPILFSQTNAFVNLLACESAVRFVPECGPITSKLDFCVATTCETCTTNDELSACENFSRDNDNCPNVFVVPFECRFILPLSDTAATSSVCSGATFEEQFKNIANYFCGPP